MMSKAIGIDLGTTNSLAGIKKIQTEILPNREGDMLTPSCVGVKSRGLLVKKEEYLVGRHAVEWMRQDPQNTIVSTKRLMGRSFHDEEVQRIIRGNRVSYEIKRLSTGSENSLAVTLGKKELTPEAISAKILTKIKEDCESVLGEEVKYAVVTVPAYFNDKQKHATRTAATLAGFKVQRLLPEPTAAAISFGVDEIPLGESRTVMVYDLGGGTFDVSILTIADQKFIEQGKGGDMWLGGDDLDTLITDHVFNETAKTNAIEDLHDLIQNLDPEVRNRFYSEIRSKVQAAKIHLSSKNEAFVEVLGLLKDRDGDIVDIDVSITRDKFDELITPLVDNSIRIAKKIMNDINFDLDLIEQVLMIGGCSYIPLVIEKVKEAFGEDKVIVHGKPMMAVAEGAAILAHRLSGTYECSVCNKDIPINETECPACSAGPQDAATNQTVEIVHTTSHDYYVELGDGDYSLLVERNTHLPFTTSKTYKLQHAEQKLTHFKFFNKINGGYESIGDLWLSFDWDDLEEDEIAQEDEILQVILDLEIDEDNIIKVSATLKDQPKLKVTRTLSRGKADEQLYLELEQSIEKTNRDKHDRYTTYEFVSRSVRIAREIAGVLDSKTGEINVQAYDRIKQLQKISEVLVEKNEATDSKLAFAERIIESFSMLIPSDKRNALERKIEDLKKKNENGTAEEIIAASDALSNEMKNLGVIPLLLNIQQAAEVCSESDPSRSARFTDYMAKISKAIMTGETENMVTLVKEIMPEAGDVLDNYSNEAVHIWKGIRQI